MAVSEQEEFEFRARAEREAKSKQRPAQTSQILGAAKGVSKVVGNLGANLPRNVQLLPNALEVAGTVGKGLVRKVEQSKNLRAGATGQALAEILMTLPTMAAGPVMGGAAQGLLTSDAPRGDVLGRARDAAVGGAFGKVGDVGTKAVAKAVGRVVKPPPVVKVDDLKAVKDAAYDAVEKSGVQYAPRPLAKLNQTIATNVARDFDPGLHPKVGSVMKNLQGRFSSGPLSIKELDQARRFVRNNIFEKSSTSEEKRLGNMIINDIDDFVNGATVNDVVGGTNPAAAAASINTARDFNTRISKVEKLQDALEEAKNRVAVSGGNIDTAIRSEMKKILDKTPNLSEEEERILLKIIRGEKAQEILRDIGRFAPTSGGSPALSSFLALFLGGPLAGGAVGGVTEASKAVGRYMTEGRAENLMRVMAAGGKPVAATGGFSPQVINAAGKVGAGVSVQSRNLAEALKGNQ
jgi:hypothetical protein